MQQVGARHFATAEPVDPRHLPVPVTSVSRRALISLNHTWVLHRRLVIRGVAALLALTAIAGLYQARELIAGTASNVAQMVQGEFAAVGFGIKGIEVTGQRLTSDSNIASMLALAGGNSTINFDVQKAQARLNWLQAVESATVRKIYPDRVVVEIVEKEPVVRWRVGDQTWLVDGEGTRLAVDTGDYPELPLIVGHGANDDALVMVRTLARHEPLKKDLAALSRIGDRRWDLIYYSGLRVQLPETGVAQALDQLEMYQRDYALLDRDVTLIDLRVPGLVALKPTVREDEADKKKKP